MVARRHDVNANLLFTWRRQTARDELGATGLSFAPMEFVAVNVVTPDADRSASSNARPPNLCGLIEIAMTTGVVVRVDGDVDGQALQRVLLAVKSIS